MKYIFGIILSTMMFTFPSEAQDWPNLSRYKDENTRLKAPSANENRVVFMGNSITEGWVRMDSAFFAQHSYIGRGISGQTTPQMLIRFKQDVVNLKPKVVVILAGTNDIAGNTGPSTLEMIEDNLSSMAELAKAATIEVVLSSVMPVFDYPWRPGLNPSQKIIMLNKWIKDYAAQHDCIYLDYFSSLVDERNGMKVEYSPDGVHPNLAGYKVMEPLAEQAINLALQKNNAMAGTQSPVMDHTTVYVIDLDKSTGFYKNVMQLQQIPEPFHDGRHNWFRIGAHSQLHVVGGAKAIVPHDINIHLAFKVASLGDFIEHLDEMGVKYQNFQGEKKPQKRSDGVSQIYFQDPDGYWIEVNDDKF